MEGWRDGKRDGGLDRDRGTGRQSKPSVMACSLDSQEDLEASECYV